MHVLLRSFAPFNGRNFRIRDRFPNDLQNRPRIFEKVRENFSLEFGLER